MVVFAIEQHGCFQLFDDGLEGLQVASEVGGDVFAFSPEFQQSIEVGNATSDGLVLVQLFFEALALLQNLLRLFLVIPEVGSGYLGFDTVELSLFAGRVKDSSAQLQLAGGAIRTRVSVLRES
jgi:hypothetical protein